MWPRAVAVALLIVVTACALLVVFLARSDPQPIQCVPDDETREQVRGIMLKAMEDALHDHLVRLHETWMKDPTGQPARATTGAQQGVRAFIAGRAAALRWNPPLCGTRSP